jgi:hypothetical protein
MSVDMLVKKSLLKKTPIIVLILVVINAIYFSKIYWLPYYNYYFTRYDYSCSAEREDFIVGTEPHEHSSPPPFVTNILKKAFPKRKIIFDNNRKPHLIIRSEHIDPEEGSSKEYQKWNAPYITISAERWSIKKNRYRRNGPPIAELVSATPKYERQIYFPFLTWCGLAPKRVYTNNKRPKFLAYIASNCVKKRDHMFALIKSRNNAAEALGMCSNPQHRRLESGNSWLNLDKVYAKYKFGLAMENRQTPGYITEKILNVFRGGAIPVYWGDSETVAKFFNPKAFIDIGKFDDFEQAADYIIEVSKNPKKMRKMRRAPIFKNKAIPDFFKINQKQTKQTKAAAEFIKKEYFKFLDHNSSRPL